MYSLKREQFLPITSEKAWDFFSSPQNLAKITPQDMGFKIVSGELGSGLTEGQIIEYIVKPFLKIPLRWKTKILNVNKPNGFRDMQLSGPYTVWEHSHRFIPVDGGIKMLDEVNYLLPAGLLGRLIHRLFIRKRIEYIFDYSHRELEKLFES